MTALTGFFSQQLLLFKDCAQRTDTAIVRLARTNNYTAAGGVLGPGTGGNWMLWAGYAPMVAATTVGLIQPVEDFTNVFARGCDSGNCTFPSSDRASFSTVAISHVCKDISGLIRQHTNYSHTITVLKTPEGAPTRLNYSDHRNYADFSVLTTSNIVATTFSRCTPSPYYSENVLPQTTPGLCEYTPGGDVVGKYFA
ncbi:hypothetical protein AA0111_g9742 [Alternaria arborescens]|uniref:hypothetical protein n=1 Tax=Alternaria arborescens TaxID=156630 RepID=UPI0010753E96|nr:hypothetical protein AA0111_g9742 [Alternaria arborescens]RYO21284.1 hypothetical protein AA0111_g9742 [Alternaria arborescens]